MGAGASKDLLFTAVQNGDLAGIRALHEHGASLEVSACHILLGSLRV